MFKKVNRLPKNYFQKEKEFKTPLFDLKIARNKKNISRFAFVVSKRIDKRATVRNRIKRKFRNCIEKNLKEIINGYDFLFILKRNIENENYCEKTVSLLKKENLYNENISSKIN